MLYVTERTLILQANRDILIDDVYNIGYGMFISDALSIQKKVAQIIDMLPEN